MQEQVNEGKISNTTQEINSLKPNLEKERRRLQLKPTDKENLRVGIQSNGKKYSVRTNRDRFFYPHEWFKFYDRLKDNQKLTFDFLINTGARYNEALNVKAEDIDIDNERIILRVTKIKAKKGEKNPRPRTISISSQFAKRLKKHIKDNNLNNSDYLGLLSKTGAFFALRKGLQTAGIKDYWMFSLHNIRKTHGNYLKALQLTGESEICKRLGHDMNTFIKHYVSSDIFTFKDKENMNLITGDLYKK